MKTMNYDPSSFAAMLTEARENAGISKSAAGRRAEMTPHAWMRYESGRVCPTLKTATKLLAAVGVEMVIRGRRLSRRNHG